VAVSWLDLSKRHAEQHLHRQAGLDRGIAVVGLAAALADRRGLPGHCRIVSAPRRFSAMLWVGRFRVL
jgi:hypothetical protein